MLSLKRIAFVVVFLASGILASDVNGQFVNRTVQLPTIRNFSIRTVVSVPDGGTTYLGGVSSSAAGQTSRGSFGPFRPFANRSSGYNVAGTGSAVSAKILSTREMDEDLTAHGNYLRSRKVSNDINGSPAVRAKAAFITRNIGRMKRR